METLVDVDVVTAILWVTPNEDALSRMDRTSTEIVKKLFMLAITTIQR
jgi:hypothetical protein